MQSIPRRLRQPLLAAGLTFIGVHPAWAEQPLYRLDLPAQPLDQSIDALARQTHSRILYNTDTAHVRQAPAVHQSLSVEQALSVLIDGTGLTLSRTTDGQFIIALPAQDDGGALELGATSVDATGLGDVTERTGSYTTGSASILKGSQSLKEIPQTVSVLTHQQMQDQNITNMDDALMQTPGISKSVANAGNHGVLSHGFTIRNFQFDGIPMGYWAKGNSGQQPDMAMFDHVEVLRGAAGMLIGAGDPSGTVNMVRKRPTDDFHLQVEAQAGSWDHYRTMLDVSGPLSDDKRLRGRAVFAYESQDYFYDGSHSEMPFFYGVMDYALSDDTVVAAGLRYQHSWQPRVWAGNLPGSTDGTNLHLSRSTGLAPDWARQLDETYQVFVDINHDFNENWHGKIGIDHMLIRDDSKYVLTGGSVDPVTLTGARLRPYYSWDNIRATGLDANLTGNFEAFGYEHSVVLGTSILRESENSAAGYGTWYNIDFNDLNVDVPEPESLALTPDNSETTNRGIYGSIRLQLADPLHLVLGSRVSWYRYHDNWSGDITKAQENGQVTPYAALLYDLTPQWTAYASYTSIFNPQYSYKSATGGALKPTTGSNYEVGLKGELFDGRVSTSLAAFYTRQEDRAQKLDTDSCHEGLDACYAVGGEVLSKGIEAQVSGEILERWQVSLGYTYNRQKYLKDITNEGRPFSDSTPKHLLRAYTSYQLSGPLERLTLGGGVTAQSDTYYISSSTGAEFAQGGYAVWNAFGRYQLDDHWSVQLNADNLFDRYYYQDQGGRLYGTPRNYTVTLRGAF